MNLVISVVLVIKIGLIGGLYRDNCIRPASQYNPACYYIQSLFERKATSYFYDTVRYAAVIILAAVRRVLCSNIFMKEVTIASFTVMIVIITLVSMGFS